MTDAINPSEGQKPQNNPDNIQNVNLPENSLVKPHSPDVSQPTPGNDLSAQFNPYQERYRREVALPSPTGDREIINLFGPVTVVVEADNGCLNGLQARRIFAPQSQMTEHYRSGQGAYFMPHKISMRAQMEARAAMMPGEPINSSYAAQLYAAQPYQGFAMQPYQGLAMSSYQEFATQPYQGPAMSSYQEFATQPYQGLSMSPYQEFATQPYQGLAMPIFEGAPYPAWVSPHAHRFMRPMPVPAPVINEVPVNPAYPGNPAMAVEAGIVGAELIEGHHRRHHVGHALLRTLEFIAREALEGRAGCGPYYRPVRPGYAPYMTYNPYQANINTFNQYPLWQS